jgi:hypothetical protein
MIQGDRSPLASDVSTTLNGCMPPIQLVLDKGGTAATDFTLHDGGHAFRVAERMCKIIPTDVLEKLTIYELAFLLLSAYLHDIGMTPELRKVTAHYYYLLTGECQKLSQVEIHDFQKWLDDDGKGITPPLTKTKPTTKDLQICQEIITYYARARHNDWGAEWIEQNLGSSKLGQYKNWVEDIIKLCRSHHVGYGELREPSFNPVLVNPDGIVVHLRYLACVLRIADILEFDPERTPSVIFRHRDVNPSSRIYWWRDHEVTLLQEGNNLRVHARPSDAPTEHAIRLMVDAINSELQICRALDEQTHFEICPGLGRTLPHRWDLSTTASMNIVPREGTYEYINGSFRPDTEKLLQLLSGTGLYGNPLMSVRELLQNAFDAVREKIAYSRLSQRCPSDPLLASKIGELQTVSLSLEIDNEGSWLVCTDNGVGMTRSIIENHLLVSGTGARHDVLDLERRCLKEGFLLGRTGQFGIGVLSYFMISDRVVINTKRGQEPGDGEGIGWRFETAGVGSFGELKKQQGLQPGTQVRLHLREELVGSQPAEWFASLAIFVTNTLQHIPCKFELSTTLPGCPTLSIGPGWCHGLIDFANKLLSEIRREQYDRENVTPVELLSSIRKQEIEAEEKHIEIVRSETKECLRWKVYEGELPDRAGRVRIHVPYFHLLGKESLAFLRITGQARDLIVGKITNGYLFLPSGETQESWKGMAVASGPIHRHGLVTRHMRLDRSGAFVEVDWYSAIAGNIGVNRTQFIPNDQIHTYRSWIMRQVEKLRTEIAGSNEKSVFWLLNRNLVGSDIAGRNPLSWLVLEKVDHEVRSKWGALKFPLVPCNTFIFSEPPSVNITWKRSKVSISRNIQRMFQDKYYDGLTWYSNATPPDRIVLLEHSYPHLNKTKRTLPRFLRDIKMAPIWTTSPKFIPSSHAAGITSEFPRKWPSLCGIKFAHYFGYSESIHIWNPEHPIVSHLDSEGWDWSAKTFAKSLDPVPLKNEVLLKRSRASAWVILCLRSESHELWDGLKDRDPTFLPDLWEVVFPDRRENSSKVKVICQWVEGVPESRLRILSPTGWLALRCHNENDYAVIMKYLPDPGLEWKVIVHHPQEVFGRKTVV